MKQYERARMPKPKSPCLYCEDRGVVYNAAEDKVVGCHSTCEKYKAFVDERLEIGAMIRQQAREENIANGLLLNSMQKSMKKRYGEKPPAR